MAKGPTIIKGSAGSYAVDLCVGETSTFRLYVCRQVETDRQCLLQVAIERAHNGLLDRSAYILRELKRESDVLEAEYPNVRTDPNDMLNYDLGFPEVVDSFVLTEQGHRRVLILAFKGVAEIKKIVPLASIVFKDRRRVDARSSAWILGKTLKTLVLAHSMGLSVGKFDISKLLIEPDQHYPILFDWSGCVSYPEGIPSEVAREEIRAMARAIIIAMGGSLTRRDIPREGNENGFELYTQHLFRLASGGQSGAQLAHREFYELLDRLWERAFHPFTTYAL